MEISATIITFNEENHLARCLQSLRDIVEEIIVVDSGSQDRTPEIGRDFGAKICRRTFTNYADQKNYAASQAKNDWILSLDADECLSEPLRRRLLDLKKSQPLAEAYAFPRRAFYLQRWICHSGWYPDFKVRLYRKSKADWKGEFVHESVRVNGRISKLDADLLHYTCDSLSEHLQRLDHYTTLSARAMHQEGKKPSLRRWLISPLSAFFKAYLWKAGFLDGRQGLIIAVLAGYYNFLKHAKLWEMWKLTGP
jgi:glycosyltransferase involved in cell wall biosynthesis